MGIFSTIAGTVAEGVSDAVSLVIPGTNTQRLFSSEVDHLAFSFIRVFDSRFDYFEKSRLRYQALQTELVKQQTNEDALLLSAVRDFLLKEKELRSLMTARFRSNKLIEQAFSDTTAALLFVRKINK